MLFIGICGASGSGKTTLARELVRDMGVQSLVLTQDAYYLDHPDLSLEERAELNYDEPGIFDHNLSENVKFSDIFYIAESLMWFQKAIFDNKKGEFPLRFPLIWVIWAD